MDGFEIRDRRFAHYILGNAPLEELATDFRWIEGLVWMGDAGCLLFQDLPRDRTMRWIEGSGVSLYRSPSGYGNGQTRDRQGRLISCSHHERCLFRTELDGRITRLVDRHGSDEITIAAGDFDGPNGLAFSPDESRLYVAGTGDQTSDAPKQYIHVFDVGLDGQLSGGEVFHKVEPGYADGLRVDEDGNLWTSAGDGVHCVDPKGRLLGKILVPHRVSNLTFGGPFRNRLFIGGSHTLYAIFLNRRGVEWP